MVTLEEEKIYREGVVSIRDLIAPAAFNVESSFLQLGNQFCRTIFIMTYPRYISVGWSSPIINLSVTMDVGMFFYPVKSAIILKQLKNKVGALQAQISSDAEKGAPRDPIRETALRDIEKLRDKNHIYRQWLDQSSGNRTLIVEKGYSLREQDVKENLVILMIMIQSAGFAEQLCIQLHQRRQIVLLLISVRAAT